jgi:hypothetical protein
MILHVKVHSDLCVLILKVTLHIIFLKGGMTFSETIIIERGMQPLQIANLFLGGQR